jgi:hypothetical protein
MTARQPRTTVALLSAFVILTLVVLAGCNGTDRMPVARTTEAPAPGMAQAESTPAAEAGMRVLFIGNSLTATNDLPAIVQALAEAAGHPSPTHKSVLLPGASLEDHWHEGTARSTIAEGGWNVVVLQQGPSALAASRVDLLEYTRRFAEEIRRIGARPAVYMVWPSRARFGDFDRVVESYALAAKEVDGLLFPAGEAWRAAWRRDPNIALYSEDGLHPTVAGSYLAALVMYERLYNRSSAGLPAYLTFGSSAEKLGLPPEQAQLLQDAATEANQRFPPQ